MALGYLLVRRPYVLAHRGASAYAPENTLAAFERAVALQSDGIETDVRASRDGVLVLVHDERVDRTTDGEGRVDELSFDELQRLDAGRPFNPRFAGERVPTVEALLERYGGRLPLCLEVKQVGVEERLVELVRQRRLLQPLPSEDVAPREQIALPPVSFTSFKLESCLALRQAAPEAMVGFLTSDFDDLTIKRVAEAKLAQICPRADACRADRVLAARDRKLSVRAWGVSEREVLRDAVKAGVDGLTCNWPDWSLQPTR
ncbi:MAG TPA: glycerophosphodiester phosphodiesterase family protein [Chloroflexota bacterium]